MEACLVRRIRGAIAKVDKCIFGCIWKQRWSILFLFHIWCVSVHLVFSNTHFAIEYKQILAVGLKWKRLKWFDKHSYHGYDYFCWAWLKIPHQCIIIFSFLLQLNGILENEAHQYDALTKITKKFQRITAKYLFGIQFEWFQMGWNVYEGISVFEKIIELKNGQTIRMIIWKTPAIKIDTVHWCLSNRRFRIYFFLKNTHKLFNALKQINSVSFSKVTA